MVFKCKMCGGDIEPIDEHIGKCLYCNSMMTLPNLNDEKIVNLYNRANDLRLKSEFDKAQKIYESILEIDNNQIEAHFGIILCKYGVEYVDDPRTKLKIPTCHRTRVESIYSDLDYEFIKKNSKGEALELYEKEAKQINSIQKRILEIANKEEPYDVFICYKETDEKGERTKDSVIAEDIYEQLINQNYRVFFSRITLEDKIGEEYEPYIFNALNSAKVMIVVGTSSENLESAWVKNEWSRYLKIIQKDKNKTLIPVYSNIDAYKLPEDFSMLQAQNMDKIGAMQDLIRGIKKIISSASSSGSKTIDEEILKKVQTVLDDDSRKISDDKYEVKVLKEKLTGSYKLISLIVLGISFVLKFLLLTSSVIATVSIFRVSSFADYLSYQFDRSNATINSFAPLFNIYIVIILLDFYYLFFKYFGSRKLAKKTCYIPIIQFLIEFIAILILLNNYLIIPSIWMVMLLIIQLVQFLLRPRWEMTFSSLIVNEEKKNKIIKKNQDLKSNFKEKDTFLLKPKYLIILTIILIIVYGVLAVIKVNNYHPSNDRNSSILQVKIMQSDIDLYINAEYRYTNKVIGKVKKGDIYTVLGYEQYESFDYNYIKIKTANGTIGYIKYDKNNIKYLLPNNIEKLIIIKATTDIHETAYITSKEVGKVHSGEFYPVIETMFNDRFKIENNDGVSGWIFGTESLILIYGDAIIND